MTNSSFIVGDAGGTSTEWRLVRNGKISQFRTVGFNAYTHDISDLKEDIVKVLGENVNDLPAYLYAAGVDVSAQKIEVEKELKDIFNGGIIAENDLLGVARSLCGSSKGNVCILGTGANACFYDGKQVNKVGASLGYILGDEGSGAYLGKKLLAKIFRNQVDSLIVKNFQERFNLTSHEVIKKIYDQPKPNHFLASFGLFLSENRNHPAIYKLIYDAFADFFDAFFLEKSPAEESFHFSGSIAFYFSDILRQVGADKGFAIKNIVQSPIAGLVLYHQKNG
ncbi:MAG: N-acetylglucosamine kinase [Ekhidna sp.]